MQAHANSSPQNSSPPSPRATSNDASAHARLSSSTITWTKRRRVCAQPTRQPKSLQRKSLQRKLLPQKSLVNSSQPPRRSSSKRLSLLKTKLPRVGKPKKQQHVNARKRKKRVSKPKPKLIASLKQRRNAKR